MPPDIPPFRPGSVLATSFTGTLTERQGARVEHILGPERLVAWFGIMGLAVTTCTHEQLESAKELRESIHAVLTAGAVGEHPPEAAVRVINDRSAAGGASASLTPQGERRWRLRPGSEVEDALGVIAADAIDLASGERDGRLALCGSPTCRAAFFDTSQSHTRRWCDMNTCGNRQKKARFKAAHSRGRASS